MGKRPFAVAAAQLLKYPTSGEAIFNRGPLRLAHCNDAAISAAALYPNAKGLLGALLMGKPIETRCLY